MSELSTSSSNHQDIMVQLSALAQGLPAVLGGLIWVAYALSGRSRHAKA